MDVSCSGGRQPLVAEMWRASAPAGPANARRGGGHPSGKQLDASCLVPRDPLREEGSEVLGIVGRAKRVREHARGHTEARGIALSMQIDVRLESMLRAAERGFFSTALGEASAPLQGSKSGECIGQ